MMATEADLEDVMDMEVHVDLHRLRDLARLGVPARLRGRVYKYLLGVCSTDKSGEVTYQRQQERLFKELLLHYGARGVARHVAARGMGSTVGSPTTTTKRFDATPFQKKRADCNDILTQEEAERLDAVLHALSVSVLGWEQHGEKGSWDESTMHSNGMEDTPQRIAQQEVLVGYAWVLNRVLEPHEVYNCVGTILRQNPYRTREQIRKTCGIFATLLHELMPSLNRLFGNPVLSLSRWVPSWLSGLLAAQLHLEDTLRLWDNYLADIVTDGFALHLYVCLSILDYLQEPLMTAHSVEATVHILEQLPRLPIDTIVTRARSLREEVQAQKLL